MKHLHFELGLNPGTGILGFNLRWFLLRIYSDFIPRTALGSVTEAFRSYPSLAGSRFVRNFGAIAALFCQAVAEEAYDGSEIANIS